MLLDPSTSQPTEAPVKPHQPLGEHPLICLDHDEPAPDLKTPTSSEPLELREEVKPSGSEKMLDEQLALVGAILPQLERLRQLVSWLVS